MKRRAIILQVSHVDVKLGESLACLVADMQDGFSQDTDFVFALKKHVFIDPAVVRRVSQKFNVETYTARNHVLGWPHGPNILWMEVAYWVATRARYGGKPWDSVLTFEPDCTPLRKTWWRELCEEFDEMRKTPTAQGKRCYYSGHLVLEPEYMEHVNGNLMFDPAVYSVAPAPFREPAKHGGWDVFWASQIMPYAKPSRLIYNDYRRRTSDISAGENLVFTEDELYAPKYRVAGNPLHGIELNPCLIHGTKLIDAHESVRKRNALPSHVAVN